VRICPCGEDGRRKWENVEEKVGEDGGESGRRWRRRREKMEEREGGEWRTGRVCVIVLL
jgi:hypothetical protein